MYRFKSIKYLTTTGVITGVLVVVGYFSSIFFGWVVTSLFGGNSTLQLFDVVFIPFCAIFKGPMMLFAGSIAGAIFDAISGVKIVVIPATIVIRVVMFLVIKLLINKYWWSSLYSFLLACIPLITLYPLYYILIYHNQAIVINELIADSIQGVFAYFAAILMYYSIYNRNLWDDRQFDYLKIKKEKTSFPKTIKLT